MAERAPLGLGLLSHPDLRGMVDVAKAAEAAGFESIWAAETRIVRDAVTAVAGILLATERIRVGSAAVNVVTRGIALLAVTWATLAEAAPGRSVLGLAAGAPAVLAQQGLTLDHPVARLREAAQAIRAAWRGGVVDYEGNHVRFAGLSPEVLPSPPPPIYFCVGGPRALESAGANADGVILDVFLSATAVRRSLATVDAGAGGRFEGQRAGYVLVSIADSRREAADRIRPLVAEYLVTFPELARETGIDPVFLERLAKTAADEGLDHASAVLPDHIVAAHSACGTAHDCRERIAEYRSAGLGLPILLPADPDSLRRTVDALAGA